MPLQRVCGEAVHFVSRKPAFSIELAGNPVNDNHNIFFTSSRLLNRFRLFRLLDFLSCTGMPALPSEIDDSGDDDSDNRPLNP